MHILQVYVGTTLRSNQANVIFSKPTSDYGSLKKNVKIVIIAWDGHIWAIISLQFHI